MLKITFVYERIFVNDSCFFLFCFVVLQIYLPDNIYIYILASLFSQVHEIQLVAKKHFPETRANFMRLRYFLLVLGKQLALHVIHEKALEALEG